MIGLLYRGLARLPLAWLYGLSNCVAVLLQHVVRYRRQTVEDNLKQAFPDASEHWRRDIRRTFYGNLCDTTVEIIAGSRQPKSFFTDRMTIRNPELLEDLSQQGQQLSLIHI